MSIFDGKRLPVEVFQVDAERLQRGWYSDAYFSNIVHILERLSQEGYRYLGQDIGDIEVEVQVFTRRSPFSIIAGVDEALSILKTSTGYFDSQGRFINTYSRLERVEAVQDGVQIPYEGDPEQVLPVIRIRGRYRDFAVLETPILGVLAEPTRIATTVFQVLQASRGKDVMFFPARFAHYKLQAMHGYAYQLAVKAYNQRYGAKTRLFISTDDQGAWWGGRGGGTMSHSFVATFLGHTPEAMYQFARVMSPEYPRVALVDFHNDCVGTTLEMMDLMWEAYYAAWQAGDEIGMKRFSLYGVRPDTSGQLRDESIEPLGSTELDCGVNPRLVWNMRQAMDEAWKRWDLPAADIEVAQAWCSKVKIVVTGGFRPEKIRRFESLKVPVDVYGVGSHLLSNCSHCGTNNDFTADVVRVKLDGRWTPMAKVGRSPGDNPALEVIRELERVEREAE